MPDGATVTEVAPPPPPVTETVTVTPEPVPPPTAVMDPELGDSMRSLLDSVNTMNASLEGGTDTGPLLLDPVQFSVLVLALALVIALLAAVFVIGLRR